MQAPVTDRLLLIIPTTTYNTRDFMVAAERLGVEVVVASDKRQVLEDAAPGRTLSLSFYDADIAVRQIVDHSTEWPVKAVFGVDDHSAVLAALACEAMGIAHNDPEAVRAAGNKKLMRTRLTQAGLPSPRVRLFDITDDSSQCAEAAEYPCVLKPVFLAASRGVIRADDADQFVTAFGRIRTILKNPAVARKGGAAAREILVEDYIPGVEVAVEALLMGGELQPLALFDKPDPLEGPFFAETVYVTPSRLADDLQQEIADNVARGAEALGLRDGPLHAELRVTEGQLHIIEIAARTIGGLCSRVLRYGTGMSLEELVLRHALNLPVDSLERQGGAAGVMMLPVPAKGVLRGVRGIEEARMIVNIDDVVITIPPDQEVEPLPEGDRYLGFIFAEAASPVEVEMSLRKAFRQLEVLVE